MKLFSFEKLGFEEYKKALRKEIIEQDPCASQITLFDGSENEQQMFEVIMANHTWLIEHKIDPGTLPSGFTHCGGYLDLRSYAHQLPSGFTHCGGYLDLRSYAHQLPSGFKKNHRS